MPVRCDTGGPKRHERGEYGACPPPPCPIAWQRKWQAASRDSRCQPRPSLWRPPQGKDTPALKAAGGAAGLAKKLFSDLHKGLDPQAEGLASLAAHRDAYGANTFKETPPKSFFKLVWENLQDPVIIILCAAATVRVQAHGVGRAGPASCTPSSAHPPTKPSSPRTRRCRPCWE